MEVEQEPKQRKRIIGEKAGKPFWIASAALAALISAGFLSYRHFLQSNNSGEDFSKPMTVDTEEYSERLKQTFRTRYEEWGKLNAPKFISFLNQDSITKEEYLTRLEKFRQEFPYQLAFNPDETDLQTWQEQVRTKFIELLTGGQEFPEKIPLDIRKEPIDNTLVDLVEAKGNTSLRNLIESPQTNSPRNLIESPYGDYTIEQVSYSTKADRRIRAFIAKPKNIKPGQKLPAILALLGHHGTPKSTFMLDNESIGWPGTAPGNSAFAYFYGHLLANQGYIVLAPDTGSCPYMGSQNSYQTPPPGWTIDGARIWDNIINLDVLCSLPEVDKDRIGTYGHSLGGEESFYIGALDKRIKAAVVAGFFGHYDAKSACRCGVIPGFENWFRISDLSALYLDKLLITETGEQDGIERTISEGKDARYLFNLFNANQNFLQIMMTGGHAFYGGKETLEKLNAFLRPDIRKTEQEKPKPVSYNNYNHHYFPGNRRQTKMPILTSNNRTGAYNHESNFRK